MELSFTSWRPDADPAAGALIAAAGARQAASPTALAQARLPAADPAAAPFAPADGAFAGPVAAACSGWRRW